MSKQIKALLIQIDEMEPSKDIFMVTSSGNPNPENKKRPELERTVREVDQLKKAKTTGARLILTLK